MGKIGKIHMKIYKDLPGVRGYFPKKVRNIVGDNIRFSLEEMKITRPCIENTGTHSIRTGQFVLCVEDREDYIGEYDLIQKDEDTFYLKRRKDEQILN